MRHLARSCKTARCKLLLLRGRVDAGDKLIIIALRNVCDDAPPNLAAQLGDNYRERARARDDDLSSRSRRVDYCASEREANNADLIGKQMANDVFNCFVRRVLRNFCARVLVQNSADVNGLSSIVAAAAAAMIIAAIVCPFATTTNACVSARRIYKIIAIVCCVESRDWPRAADASSL